MTSTVKECWVGTKNVVFCRSYNAPTLFRYLHLCTQVEKRSFIQDRPRELLPLKQLLLGHHFTPLNQFIYKWYNRVNIYQSCWSEELPASIWDWSVTKMKCSFMWGCIYMVDIYISTSNWQDLEQCTNVASFHTCNFPSNKQYQLPSLIQWN